MKSITQKRPTQPPDQTGAAGTKPLDVAADEQDMGENEVTITCPLCEAQFAPELEHGYLHSVKPDALDAAFQSVCHVCFRCHRSACPECWDNVHRVCGACVQEAGLAFRTEAAPLEGLLFPPVLRTSSNSPNISVTPASTPFVCIRPGRFETVLQPAKQPQTRHQPLTQLGTRLQTSARIAVIAQGETNNQVEETEVDADDVLPVGRFARMFKVIERMVTIVLFLVLLAVVAAIVLAEVSLPANAWIERLLHVDIHAEIAYLITLIRQIHW